MSVKEIRKGLTEDERAEQQDLRRILPTQGHVFPEESAE